MKKKWEIIFLIATLSVLSGIGCGRKPKALATIGSKVITFSDFTERLKQLPPQYLAYIKTDEDKKTLLDALVKEQLVLQEARRMNLTKDKSVQAKLSLATDQILLEEAIKQVREKKIKPSEDELKAYFDQHKGEFSAPIRIKVAHILVKEKDKADQILGQLKKGADFGKLAKENSIDPGSSGKGGGMEYFAKGEMVPEFEQAAFALAKPEQLSGIVKTPFGYHIIKLIDKKEAGQKSFQECKADLERVVEKEKFDKWLEGLKTKWQVKVDYEQLKEVNPQAQAGSNSEGAKNETTK